MTNNSDYDVTSHIANLPSAAILHFARRAQKMHVPGFTGFELKAKNIARFRKSLEAAYNTGSPLAVLFIRRQLDHHDLGDFTLDGEPSKSPLATPSQDSSEGVSGTEPNIHQDTSLDIVEDRVIMIERIQASRDELLEHMKILVNQVVEQRQTIATLTQKISLLDDKVQELTTAQVKPQISTIPVSLPDYVNNYLELSTKLHYLQRKIDFLKGNGAS